VSHERPRRAVRGDTIYTLEQVNSLWLMKANGTPLGYPASWKHALQSWDSVVGPMRLADSH
jgi:hypothetical protein